MEESFYSIVSGWVESDLNLETYYTITETISSVLLEIGHGESNIGRAILKLQTFFDQMIDGYGLIMTDEEMQSDLQNLLESGIKEGLKSISVEIRGDSVTITNLKQLKETGDAEAIARYKQKKSFDDFVPSYRK